MIQGRKSTVSRRRTCQKRRGLPYHEKGSAQSFNQRLYKLCTPISRYRCPVFLRQQPQDAVKLATEEKLEEYRQNARRYLESSDIVVFGHTHKPEIRNSARKPMSTRANGSASIRMRNGKRRHKPVAVVFDKPALEMLPWKSPRSVLIFKANSFFCSTCNEGKDCINS